MITYFNGKPLKEGDEVIVGAGDYRQYADVVKVTDTEVHVKCAGIKRPKKFLATQVRDQELRWLKYSK